MLPNVEVFVQPGGGDDMKVGWNAVKGFKLLEQAGGDSAEYTSMDDADVGDMDDHMISVVWRGEERELYYQGGPAFTLNGSGDADIVATYSNGAIAAMIVPFGKGAVGVCGPHPEAPQDWIDDAELEGEEATELWVQLVKDTVAFGRRREEGEEEEDE
eukprot:GDKI01045579.1.p1 GENE.GDKI01045579.1~~GDKI01045579.1.p1  ORF type:complete len:158 (-),score=56.69 GDKI01045579.1:368-841(-)